jgi:hypothetical protein
LPTSFFNDKREDHEDIQQHRLLISQISKYDGSFKEEEATSHYKTHQPAGTG